MTTFGDITAYYDPGLTLTVLGREYPVPLASAEVGLWCRTIAATAGEVSAASTDEQLREAGERARRRVSELPPLDPDLSFEQLMLGAAYQAMIEDRMPDPYVQFCARTVYISIIGGQDAARRYWEAGGRPEMMARGNRAEHKANTTPTTGTGEAAATNAPGSTSGTSSRQR